MSAAGDFAELLTDFACHKLSDHLAQITRCVGLLEDDGLWHRSNAHANAVGNLLLHLNGNVRQWIVAGLGGASFDRDRPREFTTRHTPDAPSPLKELKETVSMAVDVLRRLDACALRRHYRIQSYDVSGVAAVVHVVEHFSFHTGQIVHITKLLKNVDLSLYDEQGQRPRGVDQRP